MWRKPIASAMAFPITILRTWRSTSSSADIPIWLASSKVGRLDTPFFLDLPAGGDAFRVQVERVLAPTPAPTDLVVVNTLPCRKGTAVGRAIGRAGAHLPFLPPCSLDLTPIEQVFAKPEHLLRNAAEAACRAALVCRPFHAATDIRSYPFESAVKHEVSGSEQDVRP